MSNQIANSIGYKNDLLCTNYNTFNIKLQISVGEFHSDPKQIYKKLKRAMVEHRPMLNKNNIKKRCRGRSYVFLFLYLNFIGRTETSALTKNLN